MKTTKLSKKSLITLIVSIAFLCGVITLSLSNVLNEKNTNKILIYSKADNLTERKEVDLVLFFSGYTIGSPGLLANFDFGGLGLNPYLGNKYRENLVFVSIDTDPVANWGSPGSVKGVLKNIKDLLKQYNVSKIYIIGGSMGSSLALNLASQADNEIKNKIAEILVYLPITDYKYTIENCQNQSIKTDLEKHFGRNEKFIQESSPISYINDLPEKIKITFIAAANDTIVATQQVYDYYNKAKEIGKNVELISVQGDHNTGYIQNALKTAVVGILLK